MLVDFDELSNMLTGSSPNYRLVMELLQHVKDSSDGECDDELDFAIRVVGMLEVSEAAQFSLSKRLGDFRRELSELTQYVTAVTDEVNHLITASENNDVPVFDAVIAKLRDRGLLGNAIVRLLDE